MIEREMLEGETIQRRVTEYYADHNQADRNGSVDFRTIATLQDYLRPFLTTNVLAEMAFAHLTDAANEALPEDVRTEHYDIAGSYGWQLFQAMNFQQPELGAYISVFRDANGF